MTLKQDLLREGYLPDDLPPPFHTERVATYFSSVSGGFYSEKYPAVRPAIHNTSKRGLSRRNFAMIHPMTAFDLAEFIQVRSSELDQFLASSNFSLSTPVPTPDAARAVTISSHGELEKQRLARLAGYRFIARTDTSRFYHSIYTHSVPWAFHGKAAAKADRQVSSQTIFCNRLDQIIRRGQDDQTIGIPVGPDASRYIAELISVAIDREFVNRCDVSDYSAVRHVDDMWIGAQTHADAERALSRYRECLREFELDINENKTRIYSEDFQFSDSWPAELATRLQQAILAPSHIRQERLRAALEFAFSEVVRTGDDGILKYAIRQLDSSSILGEAWPTIEPFLMRCAVHFGHTVGYVVRILVWRQLSLGDVDKGRWTKILMSMLDRQARLGNDSEVCWILYATLKFDIGVPPDVSRQIVTNCGALSLVALLNCASSNLAPVDLFDFAANRLVQETAGGALWPVFLEWMAKKWPSNQKIKPAIQNEIVENMGQHAVVLFDAQRLTRVFEGVESANFASVARAIERRPGMYEEEPEPDEDDEEDEAAF